MNLYEEFIEKQNEILKNLGEKEVLEMELKTIKRGIFKKHKARFAKKRFGKSTINDDGFQIIYNMTEKISPLTELIKQKGYEADCFVTKTTPEKKVLSFSKSEYKKMSDEKQVEVDEFLLKENGNATLSVMLKE